MTKSGWLELDSAPNIPLMLLKAPVCSYVFFGSFRFSEPIPPPKIGSCCYFCGLGIFGLIIIGGLDLLIGGQKLDDNLFVLELLQFI